ncbi:hypothetical protein N0V84_003825 [Fusarium piperis]|uniref:Uncharacterized protein n=1 Tax=Fusarium piperis TaxID=1435070 RepID=A0A9W9BR13_9HYPO|nr:hypothetical protein N0V84_003825 [Fusarium piperis]
MEAYEIPSTPSEWADLVHKTHAADPSHTDISSIGSGIFGSASKLTYDDWLLLRVIWKKEDGQTTHESIFGPKGQELRATAERQLAKEPWMQALKANSDNPMDLSYLAPWKLNLSEILQMVPSLRSLDEANIFDDADPFRLLVGPFDARRRPHRTSYVSPTQADRLAASSSAASSSRGRDGTSTPEPGLGGEGRIINMTLLVLLQGVCMPLLQQPTYKQYSWSAVHKEFSVSHPNPDDHTIRSKVMTARTDGCLQVKRDHQGPDSTDTLAIIEVKPYRRTQPENNEKAVQIQEGASMAAWISTEGTNGLLPTLSRSKKYRRLLISQDFDEVYVTIAEYDDLYVQYIRGDNIRWPEITTEATQGRSSDDPPPPPTALPTQASTQLPSRSRPLPVTPNEPRPEGTSQAPKQSMYKDMKSEAGGFLVMHQFHPFKLDTPAHIEELILLLCSLTDHLVTGDAAQTL